MSSKNPVFSFYSHCLLVSDKTWNQLMDYGVKSLGMEVWRERLRVRFGSKYAQGLMTNSRNGFSLQHTMSSQNWGSTTKPQEREREQSRVTPRAWEGRAGEPLSHGYYQRSCHPSLPHLWVPAYYSASRERKWWPRLGHVTTLGYQV